MEYIENVDTVNVYIGKLLKVIKYEQAFKRSVVFDILICMQGFGSGDCDLECTTRLKALASEVGVACGKMHAAGIIHGDLTTSNILIDTSKSDKLTLCLIDFGLSHVENSAEDKAVDLYVLERALTATFSNIPWFFDILLGAYRKAYSNGGEEVYDKLEEVRLRGRKRTMVG